MAHPDEAPAYCMICNRPIATGPTCDECERGDDEDFELDDPTSVFAEFGPEPYEPSPYDGTYSED